MLWLVYEMFIYGCFGCQLVGFCIVMDPEGSFKKGN